jgi:hypothetical protein
VGDLGFTAMEQVVPWQGQTLQRCGSDLLWQLQAPTR